MTDDTDKKAPVRRQAIGRYANVFRVGFNAFEVVVEFGEEFSDGDAALMHTRVVVNPVFARGLMNALGEALASYESTYRPPDPGQDRADSGITRPAGE